MTIVAAMVMTVFPGSWIMFGLPLSDIPPPPRFAVAVAVSPAILGIQLLLLETIGIPFAVSAYILILLNIPCIVLIIYRLRAEKLTCSLRPLLSTVPVLALITATPVLIWSFTPGLRTSVRCHKEPPIFCQALKYQPSTHGSA